ncbi:MAG: hypothetical protein GX550_08035, partial [Syntrophomonadaceae bacterium]|nr:hypothetical protein [Syntrophomonadaceae bacterium]
ARKLQIEEGLVLKEINKQGQKLKGIKRNKTQKNRDNINYGIYGIEEKIMAQMVIDEQFLNYIEKEYNFKIFSNTDYYHIIDTLSKLKGKENKMQLLSNEMNNEQYGPTLARIMLLADEGYKLEPYELHEFLSKIEEKRQKENIQDFMGKINDISENGGFNRIIKLILDYNTFLIDAREGGIK